MRKRSFAEDLKLELQEQRREAEQKYEDEIMAKYTPYSTFNNVNPGFQDRREEPWPFHPLQTDQEYKGNYSVSPSAAHNIVTRPWINNPPAPTPMGRDLGLDDIMKMEEIQRLLGSQQKIPMSSTVRAMPDAPAPPPANIPPPEPQGYGGPLPQISADGFRENMDVRHNMGVTLPTSAGDFSARGEMSNPRDWKALFGFRVPF
jgi:hypothetical protein